MILCLCMNDDNQIIQDQKPQVVTDSDQQRVQPVPVGSINKETGPVSDYVKVSESEPEIHPEVAEAGVEAVSEEKPPLTEEHFKIGVKEAIPEPKIEPSTDVHYPISQQQASQTVKVNKNITNSILWMANSVIRQLKKVHGKVFKQT